MGANTDYVAKMQQQLKKWDEELDALSARGEKANAEARDAYRSQVKALRAHREAAQKSFVQMRAAGEKAGAQMKHGMEAAWNAMKKGLDKASASFGA